MIPLSMEIDSHINLFFNDEWWWGMSLPCLELYGRAELGLLGIPVCHLSVPPRSRGLLGQIASLGISSGVLLEQSLRLSPTALGCREVLGFAAEFLLALRKCHLMSPSQCTQWDSQPRT